MSQSMENQLAYYASPGPMTDPKGYADLFDELPADVPSLVKVVQGLLIHIFWAERYGVTLSEERKQELQIRPVSGKLARILELDDRPLTEPRPLEKKLVGNCRDFSVLTCAILRQQGVPSRARCGFGTYFLKDHFEDHWMCEYWNADEARWVQIDAQLDDFQQGALNIQFDPLDMVPGQFVTGAQAWLMCRAGEADPDKFGISDMCGIGFVRDNLILDFLALNKVELLPWDHGWGYTAEGMDMAVKVMDRIAGLIVAGDDSFDEVRATYKNDARFHVPEGWDPKEAIPSLISDHIDA